MNITRIVLILSTCLLFFFNFKGELIPVNEGLGWDGRLYAAYTAHIDEYIVQKGINEYRFQRILMPVILSKTMKALGIQLTDPKDPNSPNTPNMVMGFRVFNLVFLLLGLFYFILISKKLKLTPVNEIIGFAALFWCFPALKMPGYNPIITDVGAFTMGLMVTYHFLCNHRIVNLILILLGSFVYPTFILFGLLLIFPKEEYTSETKPFRIERFILPILFLIIFAWAYFGNYKEFSDTYAEVKGTNNSALGISIVLALLYSYFIGAFLPDFNKIKEIFSKVKWLYLIPIIGIFLLVKYLTVTYAVPRPEQMSGGRYLINIMKQSVANPAVFYVSHIIYLGWLPLLIIWMGKQVVIAIRANGYGLTILFAGVGLMSLGSETRQLINFYPLLVIVVLIALQQMRPVKPWVAYLFAISALILSRFWYSINADGDISKKLLEYPAQRYFQVFGPWMSDQAYMMNLVVVLMAAATFFILHKSGNLFELSIAKPKPKQVISKKRK